MSFINQTLDHIVHHIFNGYSIDNILQKVQSGISSSDAARDSLTIIVNLEYLSKKDTP